MSSPERTLTPARIGVMIAAVAGLAVTTAVIGTVGFGAVLRALATIGWRGLGFLIVYTAVPFLLLGSAWHVLTCLPPRKWLTLVWARVLRDAATEILPFSQIGGFVVGARVAILHGVGARLALATTVVDVTAELIAQLGFTALGLGLLALRLGATTSHDDLLIAGLVGLAVTTVGAVAFIAVQRRGMGLVEALARRFLPAAVVGAGAMREALKTLYRRPARLALAVAIHFCAWMASATGAWLALRLAGVEIGLSAVLAIESLVFAVRSAAFVAPMGVGVQEATYAIIGPVFGLGPEMSLALSLLKRARDLAIGLPVLLIWQGLEGHRLIRGSGDDALVRDLD